jgi:hypothetical protein
MSNLRVPISSCNNVNDLAAECRSVEKFDESEQAEFETATTRGWCLLSNFRFSNIRILELLS